MIPNALIEKGDEQPAARFLAERHSAKILPERHDKRQSVGHQTRVAEQRPLHSGMSCLAAVQTPTKYELLINLQTAKAVVISIPPFTSWTSDAATATTSLLTRGEEHTGSEQSSIERSSLDPAVGLSAPSPRSS